MTGCGQSNGDHYEDNSVIEKNAGLSSEDLNVSAVSEKISEDKNINIKVGKNGCQVKMKTPSGDILCLEKAVTPEERRKGLMFRKSLPANHGMLFLFNDDSVKGFWMKNTFLPLDIVFLDENFVVLKVFSAVPAVQEGAPDSEIPSVAYWGRNVLEIPAGSSESYGLSFGKKLIIL